MIYGTPNNRTTQERIAMDYLELKRLRRHAKYAMQSGFLLGVACTCAIIAIVSAFH